MEGLYIRGSFALGRERARGELSGSRKYRISSITGRTALAVVFYYSRALVIRAEARDVINACGLPGRREFAATAARKNRHRV